MKKIAMMLLALISLSFITEQTAHAYRSRRSGYGRSGVWGGGRPYWGSRYGYYDPYGYNDYYGYGPRGGVSLGVGPFGFGVGF